MQQAQQGQLALLPVGEPDALSQRRAQLAGSAHMVLGAAVALLQCLNERGQHLGVRGRPVQQLLGGKGAQGGADQPVHVGVVFAGGPHGELHGGLEGGGDLLAAGEQLILGAVAAQGDERRLGTAHEVGPLGEAAAHGLGQLADALVSLLPPPGSVDEGQPVDVQHRHAHGRLERGAPVLQEQLEALPALKPGQQIGFQQRVREGKKQSQPLAPSVEQCADVAPQLPFALLGAPEVLQGAAFPGQPHLGRDGEAGQEFRQGPAGRQLALPQQLVGPLVVQNQLIAVVEQHNALPQVVEDARFQPVQHAVGGVVEAAPVQQVGGQAVAADGVVQQVVDLLPGQVEEHGVDPHDDGDARHHVPVLRPVLPGHLPHFARQQIQHPHDHQIAEHQMADVQRVHLIGIPGDFGVPGHVPDGDFCQGIDREHQRLEHGVHRRGVNQHPTAPGNPAPGEVHREGQQAEQHEVDVDEIHAAHDAHEQVAVHQDAGQIAQVDHRRAQAGEAQKEPGLPVLPDGHDRQIDVHPRDEQGKRHIDPKEGGGHDSIVPFVCWS